jgi:hypothetical protein
MRWFVLWLALTQISLAHRGYPNSVSDKCCTWGRRAGTALQAIVATALLTFRQKYIINLGYNGVRMFKQYPLPQLARINPQSTSGSHKLLLLVKRLLLRM